MYIDPPSKIDESPLGGEPVGMYDYYRYNVEVVSYCGHKVM